MRNKMTVKRRLSRDMKSVVRMKFSLTLFSRETILLETWVSSSQPDHEGGSVLLEIIPLITEVLFDVHFRIKLHFYLDKIFFFLP